MTLLVEDETKVVVTVELVVSLTLSVTLGPLVLSSASVSANAKKQETNARTSFG